MIRKPQFPLDVYRAPSGGIHPGESLEEGSLREGYEETGLDLRLERYLLRVPATFRPQAQWPGAASLPEPVRDPFDPEVIHRWTHVFLARVVGDRTLDPKDTREIAEARWMTVGELQGPVRDALLATGRALFGYRVALTDATVAELERYGLLGKVLGGGFRFHVWNEPLSLIVTSGAGSELDMSPGKVRELVWYDS